MVRVACVVGLLLCCTLASSQQLIDYDKLIDSGAGGVLLDQVHTVRKNVPLSAFVNCIGTQNKQEQDACVRANRNTLILKQAILQEAQTGFRCNGCHPDKIKIRDALLQYIRTDPNECARLGQLLNLNPIHCQHDQPPIETVV